MLFSGLCFGPIVCSYYEFSDQFLPPENGITTRLRKVLMDQTIYLTIKCSAYISAVLLLAGEDLSSVSQTVKEKIGGVILTAWKFWPIVHCITYSVTPSQHRILWVNSVDLIWNAILASQAQSNDALEDVNVDLSKLETDDEDEVTALNFTNTSDNDALLIVSSTNNDIRNVRNINSNTTNTQAVSAVS